MKGRRLAARFSFNALMIGLSVFMVLPVVYMFNHAFKPYHELFVYPPAFFVKDPSLHNVAELFWVTAQSVVPVSRYLFNSLIVTCLGVIGVTAASALCAYALSKHPFPGRGLLFSFIILMLMFTPEAVQIPRYLIVSRLGIMNTYWGHLLPLMALPVGVFLLKQFMDQIPDALIEAARIDGAGEWRVFSRIALPVCMPAVVTVAILEFQNAWSNVETSALFMQDDEMKTFPFFLTTLTSNLANNVARQGAAAVAALILLVPNLVFFILLQRKVISTMAHSGIKE